MNRAAAETASGRGQELSDGGPAVLLGFDPGGAEGNHFGWAVLRCKSIPPLEVIDVGQCSNARDAVQAALSVADRQSSRIAAAAIDAPLAWVPHEGRQVDQRVRRQVAEASCPEPAGTVQHVNSLRGACLVGGIMAAVELRRRIPTLLISESHPKALIYLLSLANGILLPGQCKLSGMSDWLAPVSTKAASDHARDAAIAGLSAWAMVHQPPGWQDHYREEVALYSPVDSNLGYWMPRIESQP